MPAFINGCITNLIRNPACLPPDIAGQPQGIAPAGWLIFNRVSKFGFGIGDV